jgi:HK97 family phage major capsid protein
VHPNAEPRRAYLLRTTTPLHPKGDPIVDHISALLEERNRANKAARDIVDAALAEKRSLTAEDHEAIARADADFDAKDALIAELRKIEQRDQANAAALAAAPEARVAAQMTEKRESDNDILRSMVNGERRSYNFERRILNTSDDNELVPTEFLARVQELMLYTGPMLNEQYFTRINTSNGRDIRVPVEATRMTGTATAESAVFAESEGTFNELTLRAWKYGTLVRVSRELLDDSAIDLVSFLGKQIGTALGTAVNSALTLGTGGVQPQGIAAAAGSGVTGGTGVSGVPTFDNLIDLVHSVDTAYASRPSVGFLMRRATLGAVRKLKESTSGAYLYSPAASAGTPDTILGYPVLENPYVAATGTGAKSVLFGDLSSYHVRVQGGIEISRSDEVYFTSDEVGFRARILIDGALGQSAAVQYFAGGTS